MNSGHLPLSHHVLGSVSWTRLSHGPFWGHRCIWQPVPKPPGPQAGELHTRLLLEVPPSGFPLVSHTRALPGHPGTHRASRQLQLPVPRAHTSGSPWPCGPPLPTAVASSWLLPGDPFLPASLLLPGVTPQISFLRPDVHPRLHLHRTPNHSIR